MSNEITGWFYQHENNELIFKNDPDAIQDIRESDLCLTAWAWDGSRQAAWTILVEALALGVKKERIKELADKWECTDEDAIFYADWLEIDLGIDGNQKTARKKDFINLQESPCGFGDTYLEAMAHLCKQLGNVGGKMWKNEFSDLVKVKKQPIS